MFTEIGIENFKAFGKMQRIPLKPITLLYGPNSSGKSSLMQSLLLLKQTLEESGDDKIVLPPKEISSISAATRNSSTGTTMRRCSVLLFASTILTIAWKAIFLVGTPARQTACLLNSVFLLIKPEKCS